MQNEWKMILVSLVKALFISLAYAQWRDGANQIHHGRENVRIDEDASFVASLWCSYDESIWKPEKWCAAVFIARRWLLTAAHCLDVGRDKKNKVALKVGGKLEAIVQEIFEYPNYTLHTNIALILLKEQANNSRSIALPHPGEDQYVIDSRLNVSVYNYLAPSSDANGSGRPVQLSDWYIQRSYSQLQLAACPSSIFSEFDFTRQVCALVNRTHGLKYCPGDSGSPAVAKILSTQVLIAIISYITYNCADDDLFKRDVKILMTAFLRIEAFMPWIIHTIRSRWPDPRLQNVFEAWRGHRWPQ